MLETFEYWKLFYSLLDVGMLNFMVPTMAANFLGTEIQALDVPCGTRKVENWCS